MVNEARVEEAFKNDWSAVHEFAFPRFKEIVAADPPICEPRVPESESEFPMARDEVAADESAAEPLP